MRLKTFTAPTMAEAMEMVRQEMGEEAIIVSTQKAADGLGARVTAAIEEGGAEFETPDAFFEEPEVEDIGETVRHALTYHGTPPRLVDRLVQAALALEADNSLMAFAGALDALFAFSPLPGEEEGRPVMLIGPPGAGKTITTAKLAARATLDGNKVSVITTDVRRAGGVEQLSAFTRILKLDLGTADSVEALADAVKAASGSDAVFIDTPGTNPFSDTEMENLAECIRSSGAEPILVLPAGSDAMESADIAAAFSELGARRLLVTRLDMARRLGSILSAADAARMAFCNVSITPHVADGLSAINPVSLARLFMPGAEDTLSIQSRSTAAV